MIAQNFFLNPYFLKSGKKKKTAEKKLIAPQGITILKQVVIRRVGK